MYVQASQKQEQIRINVDQLRKGHKNDSLSKIHNNVNTFWCPHSVAMMV